MYIELIIAPSIAYKDSKQEKKNKQVLLASQRKFNSQRKEKSNCQQHKDLTNGGLKLK
jgi:hypothetical protein